MVDTARIKARMTERGYTQKALAEKVNIAQSTLSLKIGNRRPVLVEEAAVMADALGIEVQEFGTYFLCNAICVAQREDHS